MELTRRGCPRKRELVIFARNVLGLSASPHFERNKRYRLANLPVHVVLPRLRVSNDVLRKRVHMLAWLVARRLMAPAAIPPLLYIAMNSTIRNEVLRIVGWRQLNNKVGDTAMRPSNITSED